MFLYASGGYKKLKLNFLLTAVETSETKLEISAAMKDVMIVASEVANNRPGVSPAEKSWIGYCMIQS